jgi:hypothetical protein
MTNPKPREAEEFDLEDSADDHSAEADLNSYWSFVCGFRKAVELAERNQIRAGQPAVDEAVIRISTLKKLAGVK